MNKNRHRIKYHQQITSEDRKGVEVCHGITGQKPVTVVFYPRDSDEYPNQYQDRAMSYYNGIR